MCFEKKATWDSTIILGILNTANSIHNNGRGKFCCNDGFRNGTEIEYKSIVRTKELADWERFKQIFVTELLIFTDFIDTYNSILCSEESYLEASTSATSLPTENSLYTEERLVSENPDINAAMTFVDDVMVSFGIIKRPARILYQKANNGVIINVFDYNLSLLKTEIPEAVLRASYRFEINRFTLEVFLYQTKVNITDESAHEIYKLLKFLNNNMDSIGRFYLKDNRITYHITMYYNDIDYNKYSRLRTEPHNYVTAEMTNNINFSSAELLYGLDEYYVLCFFIALVANSKIKVDNDLFHLLFSFSDLFQFPRAITDLYER